MNQEIFHGYRPKVMVTGWHYPENVPKDYDAFDPPGGNQFRSTYNHFGDYFDPKMNSEVKTTQERALKKQLPLTKKPLVNMVSYSTTLGEGRKKYWKKVNITLPPDTVDCTNYVSISKSDYINYYPEKKQVKSRALLQKPETKFRRLLVDGSDFRRPGINTFYDDNQEYLNVRIRDRQPPPYGLCYTPKPYY